MRAGESAGDDALHHLGIGAEGGRALARVEDAEPAGGSGADVEEAAAGAKSLLGQLDRARDVVALRRDGVEHEAIFGVQEVDYLARRGEIDVRGAGISSLGEARIGVRRSHVLG